MIATEQEIQPKTEGRIIKRLFILTLILGAVPFTFYILAVLTNAIPSYQEWKEWLITDYSGVGHTAPLWNSASHPSGGFIFYPICFLTVLLPLFTLLAGVITSFKARSGKWFLRSLFLCAAQVALGIIQVFTLGWLVID
jgi:hypothetical protein